MVTENTSLIENTSNSIVFIHSGFRTSSTWLWSKFRDRRNVIAYNEIFHEEIENFTCANVYNIKPAAWNSRHPPSTPYFLEYLPLIKPSGGVDFYKKSMAFEKYIPEDGLTGRLSSPEMDYVGGLVSHAYNTNKIPILCCTRTLGRVSALKEAFGGRHILLIRNLFNQWQSYCYQREMGNDYFLSTILKVDENYQKDNFLKFLHEYISSKCANNFSLDAIDGDDLFILFLMHHVYLCMNAIESVDYIFDVTYVAESERDHVDFVSRDLYALTGIPLDLSDVKIDDSPSVFHFRDVESVETVAYMFLDVAFRELSATENQVLFGKKLVADAFVRYRRLAPLARKASQLAETLRTVEAQLNSEKVTRQETHNAWAAEHGRSEKLEESVRYLQSGLESERTAHRSTHDALGAEREKFEKLEETVHSLQSALEGEKATHRSTHDAWAAEHEKSKKLEEAVRSLQSTLEGEKTTHRSTHDAWAAEHERSGKLEESVRRLYADIESEKAAHLVTHAAWVAEQRRTEQLRTDNAELTEAYENEKAARLQVEDVLSGEGARVDALLAGQTKPLREELNETLGRLEALRSDFEKLTTENEALEADLQLVRNKLVQGSRELQGERLRCDAIQDELNSERTAVQYFEKEVHRLRALVHTS